MKENSKVDLPALAYKHTNVKLNNKVSNYKVSGRGTVLLKLNKGSYKIIVSYKPIILLSIFKLIAFIGWAGIILVYLLHYVKKRI